jgi:superfamily I DNA and/or RNA helicase
MYNYGHEVIKSIYQGKWLDIEYINKDGNHTRFYAFIKDINLVKKTFVVDSFNITKNIDTVNIFVKYDNILSAKCVDATYHEKNDKLIDDIKSSIDSYAFLFKGTSNIKVLDYLYECHINNVTPIKSNYILARYIDVDTINNKKDYKLSNDQFETIFTGFKNQIENDSKYGSHTELGMNILSIREENGIYVLAYKRLFLDIKNKRLICDDLITINKEYIDGEHKYSIARFLPEEEIHLLNDFNENKKKIIRVIENYYKYRDRIMDTPYIVEVGRKSFLDLKSQYQGIIDMYNNDSISNPIKAYFGEVSSKFIRRKNYPITLINNKINIDQLLTLHKAMKYPLTYVQGPPGTGKTNTIINLIVTAFFNDKSVLVSSYNNHPMNSVYKTMRSLKYESYDVMFPILRLGNNEKVKESLLTIKEIYLKSRNMTVYETTLEKNKKKTKKNLVELREILDKYEEKLDLQNRKSIIEDLLVSNSNLEFNIDLEASQLPKIISRLDELGYIRDEEALSKVYNHYDSIIKYLNFTSIKYLQQLKEPKYKELLDIIFCDDEDEKLLKFNQYLQDEGNIKRFIKVFPIIITTNSSANKLGPPKPLFDMCVMDEASQCDQATALIPIIRGNSLLLVGDPQQLNPVVILDKSNNDKLMQKYDVGEEYNYIKNSIYKSYISSDYISDEILLRHHYRCNKKIIDYNNKKYYNNKLIIKSQLNDPNGLVFVDCPGENMTGRNTSEFEVDKIIKYIKDHPNEDIGIVTPFARQKEMINQYLIKEKIDNVSYGTVHTFQGDQKDTILFSSAITNQTFSKTYNWLKNNKELINVATSRAIKKFIMLANLKELEKLNKIENKNDFYELYQHIKSKGKVILTPKSSPSRALGIKPYSSAIEEDFMENLKHALEITGRNHFLRKEVSIKSIFTDEFGVNDLFYTGVFDFVVFERINRIDKPIFAIELDGPEHKNDPYKRENDHKKDEICKQRNFKLIRVKNIYARRYYNIKRILIDYFKS